MIYESMRENLVLTSVKTSILVSLVLAFFHLIGCDYSTERSETNSVKFRQKSEISSDSVKILQEVLTTHIVEVQCGGEFVPLRNKALSESELHLSQQGSEESERLNEEYIIERLGNGSWVKLIVPDSLGYHYVQVINRLNWSEYTEQRNVRGFIVAKYCGMATLKKIEIASLDSFEHSKDHERSKEWLEYHKPNGDLLDYAFEYTSQEADVIRVLTFQIVGLNQIKYKIYYVLNQTIDLMFSGYAVLDSRYRNEEARLFSRYISTWSILEEDFEIHICEDDNYAFFVSENQSDIHPVSSSEEILERIK